MDLTHVLVLLAGVVLAVWNTWERLGRSPAARRWGRSMQGELKVRSVLVIRPLLAVVLICAGLLEVTAPGPGDTALWVTVPMAISLLVAFAYMVAPLPIPGWVKPRWYREQSAKRSGVGLR